LILHESRWRRRPEIADTPRPDERHIRRDDVAALSKLMQPRRPMLELDVEGDPDARLLEIAAEVRPEPCTLVPHAPSAFTSQKGWASPPMSQGFARASDRLLEDARKPASSFSSIPMPDGWIER
jgi:pyridoxine 5'-phosphate synthase PdxJ